MDKKENQKAFFNDKVCTTIFNWLYRVVSIGSVVGFFLLAKYVDEVLGQFSILILSILFVLNLLMRRLKLKQENKKTDYLVRLFNSVVKYFNSLMRWLHSKRLKQENKETKRVKQENKEINFLVYFVNLVVKYSNLFMILIPLEFLFGYVFYIFFPNSGDTIESVLTFISSISMHGLAILFIIEFLKEYFEELLEITWFQGLLLFSSIVIIDWLKAEDIAFFVAILFSLSMSAHTYQNIASFLEKSDIKITRLSQLLERPKNLKKLNKKGDIDPWDGKIQLQKIVLSGLVIIFYLIFKHTEQIPLAFEYFFIGNSFDTLPFGEILSFSLFKSFDRILGFLAIVLFLSTFENINQLVNQITGSKDNTDMKKEAFKNRVFSLIIILVLFILPLGFNSFANNKFQSEIETRLQVEGISQYKSTFYNRYDLRSKEKRVEVKHQCDRLRIIAIKDKTYPIGIQPIIELKGKTYQRTYIYKEKQVKLLETKEILN